MKLKKLVDSGIVIAIIVAGVYFGGPIVMENLGGLQNWSDENMGTDISSAECDRFEKDIRSALSKADRIDSEGKLESQHCSSTQNCTDMKANYRKMLSKLEQSEVNCSWVDEYEEKLRAVLRQIEDR